MSKDDIFQLVAPNICEVMQRYSMKNHNQLELLITRIGVTGASGAGYPL